MQQEAIFVKRTSNMNIYFLCLSVSIIFTATSAYPSGAPEDACQNATPRHGGAKAQNMAENGTLLHGNCPYLLDALPFVPGVAHTLNISSWSGSHTFKGFQLTVFDQKSQAVGTFGESVKTICNGAAATHSESSDKLHTEVEWTPPSNSSEQVFYIWLTIVSSYSEFWVNCDPILLPAEDAADLGDIINSTTLTPPVSTTPSTPSVSTTSTNHSVFSSSETSTKTSINHKNDDIHRIPGGDKPRKTRPIFRGDSLNTVTSEAPPNHSTGLAYTLLMGLHLAYLTMTNNLL